MIFKIKWKKIQNTSTLFFRIAWVDVFYQKILLEKMKNNGKKEENI